MSGVSPDILGHLLQASSAEPRQVSSLSEWIPFWKRLVPLWSTPVDRALAAGIAADRPAWAFAAGYQAAIQRLTPDIEAGRIASVCISEEAGAHPAGIHCRLRPTADGGGHWRLDGAKTFVTGAEGAEILVVAASCGTTSEGRNILRAAVVPSDLDGIAMSALPALGIIPEMPHGKVRFTSVRLPATALLPGDAYLDLIKPFRTLEDIHVTGAFLAWIFGIADRFGWPADVRETLLGMMAAVHALAMAPPLAPHVHLALGGLLEQFGRLLEDIDPLWSMTEASVQSRWRRDRPILTLAAAARRRRLEAARTRWFSS